MVWNTWVIRDGSLSLRHAFVVNSQGWVMSCTISQSVDVTIGLLDFSQQKLIYRHTMFIPGNHINS